MRTFRRWKARSGRGRQIEVRRRAPFLPAVFGLILLAVLGCSLGPEGEPLELSEPSWRLIWSDEFDGASLDTANWTHDVGAGGWGNNELQYYRPENIELSGGFLTIKAKRESYGGSAYTSARIQSAGKRSFTYGKFEIRARLPRGKSLWPAFWLLGSNSSAWNLYGGSVPWPNCGEIDVMEMVGGGTAGDYTVHGTLHYRDGSGANPMPSSSHRLDTRLSDAFHSYSVEWTPEGFVWRVDGTAYGSKAMSADMEEFSRPFFLLLNLAVGGNWPGYPDGSTSLPQEYVIDYVRVYEAAGR